MRRAKLTLGLVIAALAAFGLPAAASAKVVARLDKHPATPGHVAMGANGTMFVAWSHSGGPRADYAEFCRIPKGGECKQPLKLPNPAGNDVTESVAGAFPVFQGGQDVAVVAPRYVADDLLVWFSTDGGKTFDGGQLFTGYSNKSNPSDVVLAPFLAVSADNPGLGFSESAGPSIGVGFTFAAATGTVEDSNMAFAFNTLFESYWTLGKKAKVKYFLTTSDPTVQSNWSGPISVAKGYGGELAGGTGGLYIATQDYKGRRNPTAVRVRKLADTGFGAPVTLVNDKKTDLFATGDIAEAPNGHVAVIWPGYRKHHHHQKLVMRAFTSADGQSFSGPKDVANLGGGYGIRANTQLAYANGGSGYFTFMNDSGLHLANLKPGG